MAHAQQMPPEVVQSFVDNGITGYDFPELLQHEGQLLEQELGIRRQTLKRRLLRGMRMKLLGMGNHPAAPELLALATLPPSTSTVTSAQWAPAHKHSQQQQQERSPQGQGHSLPEGGEGDGDADGQSCELPTVLIQWGSGAGAVSSQLSPEFLTTQGNNNNGKNSNNGMDFPVHKYQLYRERGDSSDISQHSHRPEAGTLAGKDMLIYEVR